jgi:DNA-binding response OmpR family regulator
MDGFEFCRTVQQYADLPVIMLTAIDEEETRLKGIENFAEDFVTKPLSLHELVVRVERLLRRIGDFTYALAPVTQVDQYLAIDFFNQQVVTGDRTTPLTRIETRLLYILTHNAGRIVTTDSLLQQLWPDEETFEDALRVHIHRLRHKIEPDPRQPRYILTERGLGYSFPTCNVHRNLYAPA